MPKAIDRDTNGMERFKGSANRKLRRKLAAPSYIKFKLSNPLNTSSVNLVQYLMSLLVPVNPIAIMKNDVHNPTHVYIGRNSNPLILQNRYKPERNASDNPVGAMKVMGCPLRIEYTYATKRERFNALQRKERANHELKMHKRRTQRQLPRKLTIPAPPLPIKNSATPIDPSVICDAIVPKLTTGARHEKNKKITAGIHC